MGRVYTEAQAQATKRYMRDKRKITLVMSGEVYQSIADAAKAADSPISTYIMDAVQERMERGQ